MNNAKQMAGYLRKFQGYQRELQGTGDVHVEYVSQSGKVTMLTLYVFPNGKNGNNLQDEDGRVVMVKFRISNTDTEKETNEVLDNARKYVLTLKGQQ